MVYTYKVEADPPHSLQVQKEGGEREWEENNLVYSLPPCFVFVCLMCFIVCWFVF